jgi:hypothetical protein
MHIRLNLIRFTMIATPIRSISDRNKYAIGLGWRLGNLFYSIEDSKKMSSSRTALYILHKLANGRKERLQQVG